MLIYVRILAVVACCTFATRASAEDIRVFALVDVSGSMANSVYSSSISRLELATQALERLVYQLVDDDIRAVISVDIWNGSFLAGRGMSATELRDDTIDGVQQQIRTVLQFRPSGATHTGAGLSAVLDTLDTVYLCLPTAVIIVTDDPPNNIHQSHFAAQANRAFERRITLSYLLLAHVNVSQAETYFARYGQTDDRLRQTFADNGQLDWSDYVNNLVQLAADRHVCVLG